MYMLSQNIVFGIPLEYSHTGRKRWAPRLRKCRTLGCSIQIPNDLLYCGGHRCAMFNCKWARMTSSRYCGLHWGGDDDDWTLIN
jgi:hypothetical protein